MKKLQSLLVVVLTFVTAILGIVSVNAASYPTKLSNVKKGTVLSYNGYDSLYYKTSDDYKVFCTRFHVLNVGTSCSIDKNQWSEDVQAGVAGIIKKYNSSKTQKNYYYSELAINEFLYYYGGKDSKNRISTTRDVRNTAGVKDFYDAGVKAYEEAKKDFKFSITDSKLSFTESGDYYISNKVNIKSTYLDSYTTKVSGAKGAEIIKKKKDSFSVRVPKSSVDTGKSVTIKVELTGKRVIEIAKRFSCGSNVQTLTPNTTTTVEKTKKDSISGTVTKKGNKLIIYKRISGTKTNLAGAKLKLVSKDKKFSETWTTTEKGKTFENLDEGTYYLTEEAAPEGYEKTDEKITIIVANDNKKQEIVVENKKNNNTVIKVLKIDADTNKPVAGATLVIKDANGKDIEKWISTTSSHTVKNIKEPGKYTIYEKYAPEGYEKTDEEVSFEVKKDNKTIEYKVKNVAQKTTMVKVLKIDKETREAVAGATLVVKDANGKEIDKWVSTKEAHIVEKINKPGKYTLEEVSAPEGYKKADEVKTFIVNKDNKTVELSVENTKIQTHVQIIKIDSKTKNPVVGATLVIKDAKGNIVHSFVSTDKPEDITGLPKGKYTLIETIAPRGYELTDEVKTFEVKYDGKTVKVELENKPIEIVKKARISKQDATTSKELPGAHLVIQDQDGNIVKEWDSSTTPYEFELDPGKYTLTETIAPKGYKLSTETVEFEVKDDGTVTEVVMYNSPEDEPVIPDEPDVSKYPVKISKQDITSKEELPGATLVIKDELGNEIARWVSGTTPKEFMLIPGNYTLTEIQAPNGYDLSYEVVSFTVEENSAITTEAVMYNSKTPQTADRNIVFLTLSLIVTSLGTVFGFKKVKKQL